MLGRLRAVARIGPAVIIIGIVMIILIVSFPFYQTNITGQEDNIPFANASASTGIIALGFAHVANEEQNASFVRSLSHTYNLSWADDTYLPPGDPYYIQGTYTKLVNNSINILGNMFPTNQTQTAGNTICYNITSWDDYVLNNLLNYTAIQTWEVGQEYPFLFGDSMCSPSAPYAFSLYGGNFSESAAAYVTLLKSAYNIIKAHEPTAQVNCLDADLFGSGWPIANSTTWSEDVWADGAGTYCNAIDLHEYSWPFFMNQTNTQVYPHESESKLVNSTLNQYESLTGKPIWITETGYQSQGSFTLQNGTKITFTPQYQAAGLEQEYNFYLSTPYVKGVFWYQIKDANYSTCTSDCYYGLFDDLGNPKLALSTWVNFNNLNLSDSTITSTTTITTTTTSTSPTTTTKTTTATTTVTSTSTDPSTTTKTTTVTSTSPTTLTSTSTQTSTLSSTVTSTKTQTSTVTSTSTQPGTTSTTTVTTTIPSSTTSTIRTTVTTTSPSTTTVTTTKTSDETSTRTISNTSTVTDTSTQATTLTQTQSQTLTETITFSNGTSITTTVVTTITNDNGVSTTSQSGSSMSTSSQSDALTNSSVTGTAGLLGLTQKKVTALTYGSATSIAILGIGLLGVIFGMRKRDVSVRSSWRW